ncbi:MAG: trypsin-like serine protease [Labilithrix sp.]|nr:trypsin-like serine protease [Labilithrix sp.]
MRYPLRVVSVIAASVVSVLACSPEGAAQTSDEDLIGGEAARAGAFPSTLLVRGNCTVARVGPRHILTAAHCVYDEGRQDVRAEFASGRTIHVTDRVEADSVAAIDPAVFRPLTIAKVHVPGSYRERLVYGVRVLEDEADPDVAVMEIAPESEAALDGIPIASVDLTPVGAGEPVVIMGYGCEAGVDGPKDYSKQRLKVQKTRALSRDSQEHPGGWLATRTADYGHNVEKQYLFTPGNGATTEEASLCPGDSGGPVYRDDGQARTIVGVNAYYSFRSPGEDASRISVTNWHTRLDRDSRFDTGAWLASLGVRTAGGEPTSHYASCDTSKTGRLVCGAFRAKRDEAGGEASFGAATKEARSERDASGGWTWTQRFENKIARLDGDIVTIEEVSVAGACAGKRDGHYCGSFFADPDPRALYRCAGGAVGERTLCDLGCEGMPAGVPDRCRASKVDPCSKANAGDGRYCGQSLGDAGKALYQCKGKATFSRIECSKGCEAMPRGVPDRCKP